TLTCVLRKSTTQSPAFCANAGAEKKPTSISATIELTRRMTKPSMVQRSNNGPSAELYSKMPFGGNVRLSDPSHVRQPSPFSPFPGVFLDEFDCDPVVFVNDLAIDSGQTVFALRNADQPMLDPVFLQFNGHHRR